MKAMEPISALRRIAFILERSLAPSYRVAAFRNAAAILAGLPHGRLDELVKQGTLRSLKGIGETTAQVIMEAAAGETPTYIANLEAESPDPEATIGAELRAALRGDCHTHSLWSDGGSPIIEMARTARELGHEYIVMTDHSPRLTVANGLSLERLRTQLKEIAEANETLATEAANGDSSFRILTGIEVDILEDGTLDQEPDMLAQLDIVVASVHSKLKMESRDMTKRMIRAVQDPNVDILGHCTGRKVMGRPRAQSQFDHRAVFEACRDASTAVEINSRPERKDPPRDLLRLAVDIGCTFSIDTDAHAPGQLDWQYIGCDRAAECGVTIDQVINTRSAVELVKH
jgi:putative hydrolase